MVYEFEAIRKWYFDFNVMFWMFFRKSQFRLWGQNLLYICWKRSTRKNLS